MINHILGTKLNMSTRFGRSNRQIPVTFISAQPNIILSIKDNRAQVGYGQKKSIKKTENAYAKIASFSPRFIKEIKIAAQNKESQDKVTPSVGDKVTVAIFSPGDIVKVTGTTKGKGFAGGVKRWGFSGGPKTHGQSDRHRAPGSLGQGTTPGRVYKGKKMAGHMGVRKHTTLGLEVIEVDQNNNLLTIKGAVPGARNSFVIVEKIGRANKPQIVDEPQEQVDKKTEQTAESANDKNDKDAKDQDEKTENDSELRDGKNETK